MNKRKRNLAIFFAALLLAAGLAGFFLRHPAGILVPPVSSELDSVPEFVLKDDAGAYVRSSDLMGTSTVITLWASWCSLCREEIKYLEAAKKEFKDAVAVIAVNRAESS